MTLTPEKIEETREAMKEVMPRHADELCDMALAAERLEKALFKLHAWSRCFVEDTPISAETLWREFPSAVANAKETLDSLKGTSNG